MLRMTPTSETLTPAPLGRDERSERVRSILRARGIFARRMGHAASAGLTITYAHLSEPANGKAAVAALAEALDWDETEVAEVAGAVAITTRRG